VSATPSDVDDEGIGAERDLQEARERWRAIIRSAGEDLAGLRLDLRATPRTFDDAMAGPAAFAQRLVRLGGLGLLLQLENKARAKAFARVERFLADEIALDRRNDDDEADQKN